jgi:plastocyanin
VRSVCLPLLLVCASCAGCPQPGGPAAIPCEQAQGAVVVDVAVPAFAPRTQRVEAGQALRFHNTDDVPHAIATGVVLGAAVLADGAYTAELAPGDDSCARFTAPGPQPIFDPLYPLDMTAVIDVHGGRAAP